MSESALFEAVQAQPAPPCEVFHCERCRRCGVEKLACLSFEVYANTGKAHPPGRIESRAVYTRLFPGGTVARKPGSGKRRWANRTED